MQVMYEISRSYQLMHTLTSQCIYYLTRFSYCANGEHFA